MFCTSMILHGTGFPLWSHLHLIYLCPDFSYEGMKMLCDKYNKVVKDALHLVRWLTLCTIPLFAYTIFCFSSTKVHLFKIVSAKRKFQLNFCTTSFKCATTTQLAIHKSWTSFTSHFRLKYTEKHHLNSFNRWSMSSPLMTMTFSLISAAASAKSFFIWLPWPNAAALELKKQNYQLSARRYVKWYFLN